MKPSDLERRAAKLALREHDIPGLCDAFDALLREAVPYAVAAWSTLDPATGLTTSCHLNGMEEDREREAFLFSFEFLDGEPSTYLSMVQEGRTIAILSEETGGDLEQAARFRHLFKPGGATDELRALLWSDGRAWGSASLYRTEGWFTREDADLVAVLAPWAAKAIQRTLLRLAASRSSEVSDPPGIVQADPGGRVAPMTEPARRWLEAGGAPLVTAINIAAAAVREGGDPPGASRLTLPDGRMLSLHAAGSNGTDGSVAVIVDMARPVEVGAMLVDAYGLTGRQREVLGLLLLGRSLAEIARDLGISEHTANDHRKAIYARLGVSSRSELAALLQTEQYFPRSYRSVPPSPYGGFIG